MTKRVFISAGFSILLMFLTLCIYTATHTVTQKKQIARKSVTSPIPVLLPTGTIIKPNTVSFTQINNAIFLRYKGTFYDKDDAMNTPVKVAVSSESSRNWVGLTDGPEKSDQIAFDEIFSFQQVPKSTDFLFALRFDSWLEATGSGAQTIQLFQYQFKQEPHLIPIKTFTYNLWKKDYVFPKIDSFNSDGTVVAIALFTCWNCQLSSHKMMLVNLKTHEIKFTDTVGSFIWERASDYIYQDEPSKPCNAVVQDGCDELRQLPFKHDRF